MYVCICNAFTDSQVREVLRSGVRDPDKIHAALGCAPQCGKCLATLCEIIHRFKVANDEAGEPAGLAAQG